MGRCSQPTAPSTARPPAGAEPGKPVGTVWFGISTEEGTCTEEMRFAGERDAVRRYAAMHALDLLLRTIDQHPA